MKISSLSSVQNQNFTSSAPKQENGTKAQKGKKDGAKKLYLALGCLAAAGAAAASLIIAAKKGSISLDKFKQNGSFCGGIASYKGKPFTGRINIDTENGVKVLNYEKGLIMSAVNTDGLLKVYSRDANGKLLSVTGPSSYTNIAYITEKVKESREKLKNLLTNHKRMNEKEFSRQKSYILYKNSNDEKKLLEISREKYFEQLRLEAYAKARIQEEKIAAAKAQRAQALYNEPFDLTPIKSAKESYEAMLQAEVEARRRKELDAENFRRKLDETLGVKIRPEYPAFKSADNFEEIFKKQEKGKMDIAKALYSNYRGRSGACGGSGSYDSVISRDAIDSYARSCGYKPADYTYRCADGEVLHIIYEGFDIDIDDKGRMLQKVFAGGNRSYVNTTPQYLLEIEQALKKAIDAEKASNKYRESITQYVPEYERARAYA